MTGIVALISVVGMVGAVASLWLVLRFLRHVYDKGGAGDLKVAATAVRAARWAFVRRALRDDPMAADSDDSRRANPEPGPEPFHESR